MKKFKPITTAQATKWAGSVDLLAKALGITVQAVHKWGAYPPVKRQVQIRALFNQG